MRIRDRPVTKTPICGTILAKNGIFVTVAILTYWPTNPPVCNNYTQSVLYSQMFLLLPWTRNAVTRYPPVGIPSFCAVTHVGCQILSGCYCQFVPIHAV